MWRSPTFFAFVLLFLAAVFGPLTYAAEPMPWSTALRIATSGESAEVKDVVALVKACTGGAAKLTCEQVAECDAHVPTGWYPALRGALMRLRAACELGPLPLGVLSLSGQNDVLTCPACKGGRLDRTQLRLDGLKLWAIELGPMLLEAAFGAGFGVDLVAGHASAVSFGLRAEVFAGLSALQLVFGDLDLHLGLSPRASASVGVGFDDPVGLSMKGPQGELTGTVLLAFQVRVPVGRDAAMAAGCGVPLAFGSVNTIAHAYSLEGFGGSCWLRVVE